MFKIGSAFYELKNQLLPLYDEREATAIAHELMQHITSLTKTERLIHKDSLLTPQQAEQFQSAIALALVGTPLQYITKEAWFLGSVFMVNQHVLIPRPETEELVQWITNDYENINDKLQILDVGTGSGCIPISLKKLLPHAIVQACDISKQALSVAGYNANIINVIVNFIQLDFLNYHTHNTLPIFDIIVSNPPYIPLSDKDSMHINVVAHEPAIALFVPNNDPLIFYKALAHFGKQHLAPGGSIYCELDAAHAVHTQVMFQQAGYKDVVLRKDMHGNNRMLRVR